MSQTESALKQTYTEHFNNTDIDIMTQENPVLSMSELVAQAYDESLDAADDLTGGDGDDGEQVQLEPELPTTVEPDDSASDDSGLVAQDSGEGGDSGAGSDDDQGEDDALQVERDPVAQAPSSWSKATKALYDKLPEEVRKEVHKRESDFHAGFQALKPKADFADRVSAAMKPFEGTLNQLQQQGIDPATAINKLLQADHTLRYGAPEQKAAYMAELALQYGVDIGAIVKAPKPDLSVIAMRQQLENLQAQRQQELYSQQQQQQQTIQQQIQEFSADPKNEHFSAVRGDMALLLESGKAANLQEAYDHAVWLRPEIRQTLINRRETEAKQKALTEARRSRAKTASGSVKGGQAGKPSAASTDVRSILETLL